MDSEEIILCHAELTETERLTIPKAEDEINVVCRTLPNANDPKTHWWERYDGARFRHEGTSPKESRRTSLYFNLDTGNVHYPE
jgi:hypothetical protein